jgi:hypothetical protein
MVRLTAGFALAASVAVCPWITLDGQQVTAIRAGRLVDVDKGQVVRNQLIVVRATGSSRCSPDLPAFLPALGSSTSLAIPSFPA